MRISTPISTNAVSDDGNMNTVYYRWVTDVTMTINDLQQQVETLKQQLAQANNGSNIPSN